MAIKELRVLSDAVLLFLHELDVQMKLPSTHERGKRIATLSNWLDLQNDQIRFGTLGIDYRKDDKEKAVAKLRLDQGERARIGRRGL